jgi:hypothetical protein
MSLLPVGVIYRKKSITVLYDSQHIYTIRVYTVRA